MTHPTKINAADTNFAGSTTSPFYKQHLVSISAQSSELTESMGVVFEITTALDRPLYRLGLPVSHSSTLKSLYEDIADEINALSNPAAFDDLEYHELVTGDEEVSKTLLNAMATDSGVVISVLTCVDVSSFDVNLVNDYDSDAFDTSMQDFYNHRTESVEAGEFLTKVGSISVGIANQWAGYSPYEVARITGESVTYSSSEYDAGENPSE